MNVEEFSSQLFFNPGHCVVELRWERDFSQQ